MQPLEAGVLHGPWCVGPQSREEAEGGTDGHDWHAEALSLLERPDFLPRTTEADERQGGAALA